MWARSARLFPGGLTVKGSRWRLILGGLSWPGSPDSPDPALSWSLLPVSFQTCIRRASGLSQSGPFPSLPRSWAKCSWRRGFANRARRLLSSKGKWTGAGSGQHGRPADNSTCPVISVLAATQRPSVWAACTRGVYWLTVWKLRVRDQSVCRFL